MIPPWLEAAIAGAILAVIFSAGIGLLIALFMRAAARTPMPPAPGDPCPPDEVPAPGPIDEEARDG